MIAIDELREAMQRPAKGETKRLAGALAQAHEELHLLYELGTTLAAELPLETEAAVILERILATVPASRAELRVSGSDVPIFVRHGQLGGLRRKLGRNAEHRLRTILRSGGEEVGTGSGKKVVSQKPHWGVAASPGMRVTLGVGPSR